MRESMELVRITELANRDFNKISDGQKQRVMLARALCQQPDVIVLDEPTSFLDIRYKLEFLSILQEMSRKRNLTVLMSLHELDLAGRISDKIACVQGDRIDRFGTPEEIFTQGYIPQLYQMTTGSYDELTGDLELPSVQEKPEIFVIAGNGTGTSIFRRLQRERKAFATGILWENDIQSPHFRQYSLPLLLSRIFLSCVPVISWRFPHPEHLTHRISALQSTSGRYFRLNGIKSHHAGLSGSRAICKLSTSNSN